MTLCLWSTWDCILETVRFQLMQGWDGYLMMLSQRHFQLNIPKLSLWASAPAMPSSWNALPLPCPVRSRQNTISTYSTNKPLKSHGPPVSESPEVLIKTWIPRSHRLGDSVLQNRGSVLTLYHKSSSEACKRKSQARLPGKRRAPHGPQSQTLRSWPELRSRVGCLTSWDIQAPLLPALLRARYHYLSQELKKLSLTKAIWLSNYIVWIIKNYYWAGLPTWQCQLGSWVEEVRAQGRI